MFAAPAPVRNVQTNIEFKIDIAVPNMKMIFRLYLMLSARYGRTESTNLRKGNNTPPMTAQ